MIDPSTYRLVVGAVAGALVLCIIGIVVLAVLELAIPDILENATVGSLTGLVGLLASPRPPAQVEVVNDDDQPVPVTEGG